MTAELNEWSNPHRERFIIAKQILLNLLKYQQITPYAISRILDEENYYYYVHFSERWRDRPHPRFENAHPDGYVVIEGAHSLSEAKSIARQALGHLHLRPIFEGAYKFPDKPLGELARFKAEDYLPENVRRLRGNRSS